MAQGRESRPGHHQLGRQRPRGGDPHRDPDAEGSRTTPVRGPSPRTARSSWARWPSARPSPTRTHHSFRKRHMGTNWTINTTGKAYTPQEIRRGPLMKLKRGSDAYLGDHRHRGRHHMCRPIRRRASAPPPRRPARSTGRRGTVAILNEPTAAARRLRVEKEGRRADDPRVRTRRRHVRRIVLEIADGVFEEKSTHGDTRIGRRRTWEQTGDLNFFNFFSL